MRIPTVVFLLIALLVLPLPVRGMDEELELEGAEALILAEEIPSVYGASKYEQKLSEAPSSVSIVTADEIRKYGYRTLADILRSMRSIQVTYDRNYHYLGVRGFGIPGDYNNRVLFLVDGHRLNDSVYSAGAIGTDFVLDVDLIDRVEFVRGPSSSIYGSNAFFGVINVITKSGRDYQGIEVSGEAGSQDTYRGRISAGHRFRSGFEVLLSGTLYSSDGDDDLYYEEYEDPASEEHDQDSIEQDGRVFRARVSYLF